VLNIIIIIIILFAEFEVERANTQIATTPSPFVAKQRLTESLIQFSFSASTNSDSKYHNALYV
jgi:hypothetical protein